MIVSSRTPEGRPNHCPLCDKDIVLEPSSPFGDAPCPCCGQLLWVLSDGEETRYFKDNAGEPIQGRLVRLDGSSPDSEAESRYCLLRQRDIAPSGRSGETWRRYRYAHWCLLLE